MFCAYNIYLLLIPSNRDHIFDHHERQITVKKLVKIGDLYPFPIYSPPNRSKLKNSEMLKYTFSIVKLLHNILYKIDSFYTIFIKY